MQNENKRVQATILIAMGKLMVVIGVLALFWDSEMTEWAGISFVGLGNLILGISFKDQTNASKKKNLSYLAAAASLIGIFLFGIHWFRVLT